MAPRLTNRSEKRKNATEREKARMEKMNQDIDYIQAGFQIDVFYKNGSHWLEIGFIKTSTF